MPTPWIAWKNILSCKQDSQITRSVHDPCKPSIPSSSSPSPSSSSSLITPLSSSASASSSSSSSSSSFVKGSHSNTKKRRGRIRNGLPLSSPSVCCNNLKNVVHGNTKVFHRGDHESPLSHHIASTHKTSATQLHASKLDLITKPHQVSTQNASKKSCSSDIASDQSIGSVSDKSLVNTKASYNHGGMYETPSFSCDRHAHKVVLPQGHGPLQFQSSHHSARHTVGNNVNASNVKNPSSCLKCGEICQGNEALEMHHANRHSVTELKEGDSARSIVEIIFQTSWLRQDIASVKPESIFKVHNSPKTLARFEEYRDMVKAKASRTSRKNSRCLVDGNELLRFYSTTISCSMGMSSSSSSSSLASPSSHSSSYTTTSSSSSYPYSSLLSSSSSPSPSPSSSTSLCTSSACGVCNILRHGFAPAVKGHPGIYTNASSGKAHDSVCFAKEGKLDGERRTLRAMIVCRVIAGRVKKMGLSSDSSQDGNIPSVYDSVSGEATQFTDLEELLVFNSRAVLPCFIVLYNC